jgi:hypothetical protein
MTKIIKTIEKWKSSKQPVPKHEVISVVERYFPDSYEYKSGSHIVVRHPMLKGINGFGHRGEFVIAIKGGKKVKPVYLKTLIEAIEYLEELNASQKGGKE